MSNERYIEEQSPLVRLRIWAFGQMAWGAFMAAAGLVILGTVLLVIWAVGQMLPEQSKQAPSPYGSVIIAPQTTDIA
jgi:hypothetical protein